MIDWGSKAKPSKAQKSCTIPEALKAYENSEKTALIRQYWNKDYERVLMNAPTSFAMASGLYFFCILL